MTTPLDTKDPLRTGLTALPPGTTVGEMAKAASVSTKTIGDIQSGGFKERISGLLKKKTVDVRLYRGLINSLVRVSTSLGLDPLATATAYGFPNDQTLANAIEAARSETQSQAKPFPPTTFEVTLSTCKQIDLDVTMVGSPKGGVGKTLFLIHAGLIQATGCAWAGIDPEFALLMDFDFNAPGLHTFPLRKAGDWMKQNWLYRTMSENGLSQQALELHLRRESMGLVFLLNSISDTDAYTECDNLLHGGGDLPQFDQAVQRMSNYLVEQCSHPDSPTCLLRHLVSIIDESGEPKLAIMPAGSPRRDRYPELVNRLVWPMRMAQGMGIVLEKALLRAIDTIGKDNGPEAKRLIRPIKKFWIDQGPGEFGNVSDANRRISFRQVQVSSLALQSSAALQASIERMTQLEREKMWVLLTYYRGRPLQTKAPHHFGDALTFASIDRAEREFQEADREREEVVESLGEVGVERGRITIADFDPTLVNCPDLREPGSVYFDCVVRTLLSMHRSKATAVSEPIVLDRKQDLMILGEYCGNPHRDSESQPAGVLQSFVSWISSRVRLPRGVRIRAIAADHEQIAQMAGGDTVQLWVEDRLSDSPSHSIERAYPAKTKPGLLPRNFSLSDFDIAAIPSYACDDKETLLSRFPVDGLASLQVRSSDCLSPIGNDYLAKNIHGWRKGSESICGVPLFSHFQLIVSNRDAFRREPFQKAFKVRADKRFAGWLSFADIRNTAIVSRDKAIIPGDNNLEECLLITVTDPIARVYDWLTVLGIVGCNPFKVDEREEKLASAFSTNRVFESTLNYALLDYLAWHSHDSQPQKGDWNETLSRIAMGKAGFTFVWPDAIPANYLRDHEKFQYSPIPALKQLTESWLLVLPNRNGGPTNDMLWKTLIQFLTLEEQREFCRNGAVPVHAAVANDPGVWRIRPYVKTLGFIRALLAEGDTFEIPPRPFNARKLRILGEKLADFCVKYAEVIKEMTKEDFNWRTAIQLSQDPRGYISKPLRDFWEAKVQEFETEIAT